MTTIPLLLHGDIGEDVEWPVGSYYISQELRRIQRKNGTDCVIQLRFDSPGGSTRSTNAIFHVLWLTQQAGTRFTGLITGACASCASWIACEFCETLVITPSAWVGVHLIGGNDEVADRLNAHQIDIYQRRTKLPEREIVALLERSAVLHAPEALTLGFVDAIEPDDENAIPYRSQSSERAEEGAPCP